MLVLSRKRLGEIHVDLSGLIAMLNDGRHEELAKQMKQPIVVSVVDVRGNRARLGFEAVPEIVVHRKEVMEKIQAKEGAA